MGDKFGLLFDEQQQEILKVRGSLKRMWNSFQQY